MSEYDSLLPEVTSEVTPAPKKRGRPKKLTTVVEAAPAVEADSAPAIENQSVFHPVSVVLAEPELEPVPVPRPVSVRTQAEVEAGQRALDRQRRR